MQNPVALAGQGAYYYSIDANGPMNRLSCRKTLQCGVICGWAEHVLSVLEVDIRNAPLPGVSL